jgi:DNA integrity scanning protein DisA with diadenylate cyclase activity
MSDRPYAAARTVATRVHAHFLKEFGQAPDPAQIEALIDVAFWASLRREEGYAPRISLALVDPAQAGRSLTFEEPLALTPERLTKLAPAVERPGIHLGVWPVPSVVEGPGPAGLMLWGATRTLAREALVLEVVAPGVLVVKHRRRATPGRADSGKFINVAVIEGDRIKTVDERGSTLPDCPPLVHSLVGFSPGSWNEATNVLVELALSMRAHGRGGTLLVVKPGSSAWIESMSRPIAYSISPAYSAERNASPETLRRFIDGVAGLTAVDGAAVITDQFEVLAFGAKIVRRRGQAPVEQVHVTEPIEESVPDVVSPSHLGGTRHLSAAQFVHDQRDAVALVASQDGRFTVFAWSPCENLVHAHRVEVLLV